MIIGRKAQNHLFLYVIVTLETSGDAAVVKLSYRNVVINGYAA